MPKFQNIKPIVFLKEVKTELNKVSWPSRENAIRLTLIVILVSGVVAAFLGFFDLLFTKLTEIIIKG